MKRSIPPARSASPSIETVLQFVDDEISKVVAGIAAGRATRPPVEPRHPQAKLARQPASAA